MGKAVEFDSMNQLVVFHEDNPLAFKLFDNELITQSNSNTLSNQNFIHSISIYSFQVNGRF